MTPAARSGIVQGFSTPPLLLLILLMTNNRKITGGRVNSRTANVLGWITVVAIFSASIGLVASWFTTRTGLSSGSSQSTRLER